MTRFIREPLVHFVLIAIAIFIGFGWLSGNRQSAESTIVISQADIDRLVSLYVAEAGALPSDQDLRAIIIDQVQQQALAREARRLGMADGDTVVERRLAQKMTFMLSDLAQLEPPGDVELQAWLDDNRSQFEEPVRVSFDHVFFSDPADLRIEETRDALNAQTAPEWRGQGDPFMLQRLYAELPHREIVRLFGSDFADELLALGAPSDVWQGPVSSALGTHLVRITKRTEAYMPTLAQIRPAVVQAWQEESQRQRTADEIANIVSQYEVVIESASGS